MDLIRMKIGAQKGILDEDDRKLNTCEDVEENFGKIKSKGFKKRPFKKQ